MTPILKGAAIVALVGAAAFASVTQSEARNRWIGPAAAGFAAGAIVGGVAANSNAYYGRGYDSNAYYGSGYSSYGSGYSSPGYSYGPAYSAPAYDAYAYEAAPVYTAPRYYRSRSGSNGCTTQGNYGQSVDESACNR